MLSKLKSVYMAISTGVATILGLLLALSIGRDRKRRLKASESDRMRYDRERKNEKYMGKHPTDKHVADINRLLRKRNRKTPGKIPRG